MGNLLSGLAYQDLNVSVHPTRRATLGKKGPSPRVQSPHFKTVVPSSRRNRHSRKEIETQRGHNSLASVSILQARSN